MDKQEGFLEVTEETETGTNLRFRDKRTNSIYTMATLLLLYNRDLELRNQYDLVDRNGRVVIKSKKYIENLG